MVTSALDTTLCVYERLQRESPRRDPRFRLEHCTVINDNFDCTNQSLRRHPDALFDLRLLSWRKKCATTAGSV